MNPLKILFLLLFLGNVALAQTNYYEYKYDEAGNRISRKYVKMKKKVNLQEDSLLLDSLYNDSIIAKEDIDVYKDNIGDKEISIFPNPTKGKLRVEISNIEDGDIIILKVFDLQGREIYSNEKLSNYDIDLSNYENGVYLLDIILNNEKSYWKIVKE